MLETAKFYEFDLGVSARIDEINVEQKNIEPNWMSTGLFSHEVSDSMVYRTKGATGLARLQKFGENSSIAYDETYPMYATEYPMQQFGLGVTISKLLMNTRSSELESKLNEAKELKYAAIETLEHNAWKIFVDAFGTTNSDANAPTSRLDDAVALISASHPSRVDGVAVRSNVIVSAGVTNPTLGETALFDAQRIIAEQKNGRGLPMNYQGGFILIVPKALEKVAVEITKSTKRSGTTDNDLNYFEGTTDVIASTYLGAANGGSDTAWFVVAKNPRVKPLKYVTLGSMELDKDTDFDTKNIKVSIDGAYAFGYSNWEFIAGSNGTLA